MVRLRGLVAATLLVAARTPLAAQVSAAAVPQDSVSVALRAFALTEEGVQLNGRFTRGNDTVAAGDTVAGPLVVVGGHADVRGTVLGNVYAIFGDVTIHDGADVRGGVAAWRGQVIIDGGRVRGSLRAWPVAAARPERAPISTARALVLVAGWTGMMVVVGLLVLMLATPNLTATARVLEASFGRAFLAGVVGQLAFLPLCLLLVASLAVTIVGVLLIPFALVVAPIALAGIVTLGWNALALVAGRALRKIPADASRSAILSAMGPGIVLLMLPWLLAAMLHGAGTAGFLARIVALAVTWVAATAGLGGALLSRAGTAKPKRDAEPPRGGPASWQTPTPVAGVAAARRPIPARPPGR
jgi:hypothetical protein